MRYGRAVPVNETRRALRERRGGGGGGLQFLRVAEVECASRCDSVTRKGLFVRALLNRRIIILYAAKIILTVTYTRDQQESVGLQEREHLKLQTRRSGLVSAERHTQSRATLPSCAGIGSTSMQSIGDDVPKKGGNYAVVYIQQQ